jgi:hypothetical protein
MNTVSKSLLSVLPLELEAKTAKPLWLDFVWLVFLGGLALLPPVDAIQKYFISSGFGKPHPV